MYNLSLVLGAASSPLVIQGSTYIRLADILTVLVGPISSSVAFTIAEN